MEEEYKPEETVFTISHAEIEKHGTKMCEVHSWRKLSENEVVCKNCPTALIVGLDDERLLAK